MGIHGIYKEIGPGQRIALAKLAVENFEKTGRPLRIAIDVSIWLFQIQAGKGGSNPALRTFYYRLLRLMTLAIHPVFVFDGPNKPPFKRNKRTGPNVASIPEFLAKQLLKQFGFPIHPAPGEAEAECALLQREGIVDAVLSEDVDTLMFGSGITLRNWTAEGKTKTPSHVNLFDAKKTKSGPSGLDREGMILVALMSGGDYVPQGIPGCGPKIACEAARAGFGADLYKIKRNDKSALRAWRERLEHELRTNESKFFKTKHGSLKIPETFPDPEIRGYYTHPVVSTSEMLERVRSSLKWDQDIDLPALRTFTGEAFDWRNFSGAKKFIRNLAPALLMRSLRMTDQSQSEVIKSIKGIHGVRNHASTDGVTELRISFVANDIVDINLATESPDDEFPENTEDADEEELELGEQVDAPDAAGKKRGPYLYDPTKPEKQWILETYVKVGSPALFEAWESMQAAKRPSKLVATTRNKEAPKRKGKTMDRSMPTGALNSFTKVRKPGQIAPPVGNDFEPRLNQFGIAHVPNYESVPKKASQTFNLPPSFSIPESSTSNPIEILSSSPAPPPNEQAATSVFDDDHLPILLPSTITKRRRPPLRRARTDPTFSSGEAGFSIHGQDLPPPPSFIQVAPGSPTSSLPSPSQFVASRRSRTDRSPHRPSNVNATPQKPARKTRRTPALEEALVSSPRRNNIDYYFSPQKRHEDADFAMLDSGSSQPALNQNIDSLDLTMSSPAKTNMSNRFKDARRDVLANSSLAANRSEATTPIQEPGPCSLASRQRSPLQSRTANSQARVAPPIVNSGNGSAKQKLSAMDENDIEELDLSQTPRLKSKSSLSRDMGISHKHGLSPNLLHPKKQRIRVRESLVGAFVIEEVDLSEMSARKVRKGRIWRQSDVEVFDLTGGD